MSSNMECVPEHCSKPVLILGCGNLLFGDDAFGPYVAQAIEKSGKLPQNACVIDAGTGVRDLLFDLTVGDIRPDLIIVIDAIDSGRKPGEIYEIDLDAIPFKKTDDFSLHQVPTSNMLKELRDIHKVAVRVLACQVKFIPEEINQCLSPEVEASIPKARDLALEWAQGVNLKSKI